MAVLTRVSSPALIGRGEEVTELRRVLGDVLAGGSACAVVAGEAGLGKTRLVRELLRDAGDVELLVGGCVEVGPDVLPYAPFVDVLSDLAQRHGAAEVRALGGPTGSELTRLLPDADDAPDVTPASASRLYAALRALVAGLAARRPLVLLVEDLHWSDRSTRDLLGLLAHRLPPRTLLLLTARTDEAAEQRAVPLFLAQLAAAGAHRIELRPFTREEQALQLSGILGIPPTRSRLVDVYARAEGNPFFAEELVALGASDVVPVTVRDLLLARVDALPSRTRRVVRAAAAAGRRVEHGLLLRAVDLHEPDLDEALSPAIDAHLLVPHGNAYVFRHALLHETVAAALLPGERARLHRRLAEALAGDPSLADSRHGLEGRIAHHWLAAGDWAEGRLASYRAAREAVRTLAFDEALVHYERVVELSGDADDLPMPRYRVLWDAAEAAHRAGAADRAAVLVQQAIACVDPEERHHRAYLHQRLGRYLWMAADGQRAGEEYRRAVELVPTEPVTSWQAAIVSGWSQMLMLTGRFDEARTEAERAISLAAQVSDGGPTDGHARNNLGVALAHLGELDRGIAELRAAARIAREQSDDVDDIARAVVNLHSVLFDAGRFQEALAVAVDGIATVDQLGLQRRKGVWCRCDAVEALLVLGRCDEAEPLLREALVFHPQGIDAVRVHGMHGALALRRGRLDEARSRLERARRLGRSIVDGHVILPIHHALLETLRWQGDWSAAVDLADDVCGRAWSDGDAAYLVPVLAMAAGAAADGAVAARAERRTTEEGRLTARTEDFLRTAEVATARPQLLLPPARVALATARAERFRISGEGGARAWADVAASWRELGDAYRAGCAFLRQAECQLADRRRAGAADSLRAARQASIATRAQHLLRAVEATARRARLPLVDAAPEPAGRFHLSSRECDVLALVARGRTDRQIGAELFISHRTVERHVSNILAKLDAHTRAEVTAIAHRQGLVVPGPREPAGSGRAAPRTAP
ncbi:MAG: transcriptional regulator, LuxR family [Blastococcus sp.]|nr:transcriptional regulator, LuxR family [Blastococcus sp.]